MFGKHVYVNTKGEIYFIRQYFAADEYIQDRFFCYTKSIES